MRVSSRFCVACHAPIATGGQRKSVSQPPAPGLGSLSVMGEIRRVTTLRELNLGQERSELDGHRLRHAFAAARISLPHGRPRPTSRDFVPWRFLDAGCPSAWLDHRCRRRKLAHNLHITGCEQMRQLDVFGKPDLLDHLVGERKQHRRNSEAE